MKKNIYYHSYFKRRNALKDFILSAFQWFSSCSRLMLEVFIRKNFGERYFKLSAALTLAAILAAIPLIDRQLRALYMLIVRQARIRSQEELEMLYPSLWPDYIGWYVFIALFVAVSVKHYKDNLRYPSVYDFDKFSLSKGEIHPAFYKVKLPYIKTDMRLIECLLEPGLFFVIGLLLYFIGQSLGTLLMFMSFFYAYNYIATYDQGDDFVMDIIDQMILNEEMEDAFVKDVDASETRGFSFRGRKPAGEDMRRKILPMMMEEEEVVTAE